MLTKPTDCQSVEKARKQGNFASGKICRRRRPDLTIPRGSANPPPEAKIASYFSYIRAIFAVVGFVSALGPRLAGRGLLARTTARTEEKAGAFFASRSRLGQGNAPLPANAPAPPRCCFHAPSPLRKWRLLARTTARTEGKAGASRSRLGQGNAPLPANVPAPPRCLLSRPIPRFARQGGLRGQPPEQKEKQARPAAASGRETPRFRQMCPPRRAAVFTLHPRFANGDFLRGRAARREGMRRVLRIPQPSWAGKRPAHLFASPARVRPPRRPARFPASSPASHKG